MIAAEGERNVSILAHIGDVPADHRVVLRRVFGQRQVAVVGESDVAANLWADFGTEFARHIAAVAPQRLANRGGTGCGAAFEAAVAVGGPAATTDHGLSPLLFSAKVPTPTTAGAGHKE